MSNSLTLPFAGTVSTEGVGFEVTNTATSVFGVTVGAVVGRCTGSAAAIGVLGRVAANNTAGIMGVNEGAGDGANGQSVSGAGVRGVSQTGPGVFGNSNQGEGVHGETRGNVAAVAAFNRDPGTGQGVWAHSDHGVGVHAESPVSHGVYGLNQAPSGIAPDRGAGVWGDSQFGVGVIGTSQFIGVVGQGNVLAARFVGPVEVTGEINAARNINIQSGGDVILSDCAEDFDVAPVAQIQPGSVVVITAAGAISHSSQPYDRRVAGVVSGAGDYRPAIVLDKRTSADTGSRVPIALVGKTYCKVDASYGPIELGDLLTTSPTPGHAMKATELDKCFGAVIGKALHPLKAGRGLIPILIALQ